MIHFAQHNRKVWDSSASAPFLVDALRTYHKRQGLLSSARLNTIKEFS